MAAHTQAHAEVLSADLKKLKSSPQSVTSEEVEQIRRHLQDHHSEFGTAEKIKAGLIGLLLGVSVLSSFVTFGFFGAALLWGWQGQCSWWFVLFMSVLFPLHLVACRQLDNCHDRANSANWPARWVANEFKPWGDREWRRAQVVQALSPEAEEYFNAVTSAGTPVAFQLQALHRLANVYSELDEADLDEGFPCNAPRTTLHLRQHPNWKPSGKSN
jgi:hypothetical protein